MKLSKFFISAALCLCSLFAFAQTDTISILIDDMGNSLQLGQMAATLPGAITCSIMPFRPNTHYLAKLCHSQGKDIIVHVPMQAEDGEDMGAGGLSTHMSISQIHDILMADLSDVPYRNGMNNHMGSALTQDQQAMNAVMHTLQPLHIFYIDSMTIATSVAEATACRYNVPTLRRDVFLDDIRTTAAIDHQFQHLIYLAHKYGYAIAIGHPYPSTLDYLEMELPQLSQLHVQLIPVSAMVATHAHC